MVKEITTRIDILRLIDDEPTRHVAQAMLSVAEYGWQIWSDPDDLESPFGKYSPDLLATRENGDITAIVVEATNAVNPLKYPNKERQAQVLRWLMTENPDTIAVLISGGGHTIINGLSDIFTQLSTGAINRDQAIDRIKRLNPQSGDW